MISQAVDRMQRRIADPKADPITMMSHHDAGDDSLRLCGRVTKAWVDEKGQAHWSADISDTATGRDMANLAKNGYLPTVSLRGRFHGERTVEVEGRRCETGDDLEIDGIDFTKSPGVEGARIDSVIAESVRKRWPVVESDSRVMFAEVFEFEPKKKGRKGRKNAGAVSETVRIEMAVARAMRGS